jgi:hypothetical protein
MAQGLMYEIIVIEECLSPELLGDREIYWIAKLTDEGCALTNSTLGGEGPLGRPCSPETRAKIGRANAARLNTPEVQARSAASRLGKPLTPAQILALENLHVGNQGQKRSLEFSQALSARFRGKPLTESHRKKLSDSHKDHYPSEETLRRRSSALKGRVVTPEHRAKLSDALKGHVLSGETREKIRQAHLLRVRRIHHELDTDPASA